MPGSRRRKQGATCFWPLGAGVVKKKLGSQRRKNYAASVLAPGAEAAYF